MLKLTDNENIYIQYLPLTLRKTLPKTLFSSIFYNTRPSLKLSYWRAI